ncbi:hypothetical protein AB0958_21985 [Streptomyces sp. NPDC006655]|uniref:hypothetical protein n=1 Tax=Streptomyces sp. NPDC006655 TaxID=3156898 RepID=UPI00345233CF
MNITAAQRNGKHYGEVRNGDRIVFRSAGYITERMALADARCWVAFHGKAVEMVRIPVSGGREVEISLGAMWDVWNLWSRYLGERRGRENFAAHRTIKELRALGLGLEHSEFRDVYHWVNDQQSRWAEEGRKAVERFKAER